MCKMLPYKYPTVWSHLDLFSSSPFVGRQIFILCVMESLMIISDILTQLKQLTEGMASIRQDVDALELESLLYCTTDEIASNGDAEKMADDSAPCSDQPPATSSSGLTILDLTTRSSSSSSSSSRSSCSHQHCASDKQDKPVPERGLH